MGETKETKVVAENNTKQASSADFESFVKEIQELKLDIHELNNTMTRLTEIKKREFQWRFIVPISLLRGLGTAVGATIVFAVLLYILGYIFSQLESVPILERILESIPWDQIADNNSAS